MKTRCVPLPAPAPACAYLRVEKLSVFAGILTRNGTASEHTQRLELLAVTLAHCNTHCFAFYLAVARLRLDTLVSLSPPPSLSRALSLCRSLARSLALGLLARCNTHGELAKW
jgi:hypothetical protein